MLTCKGRDFSAGVYMSDTPPPPTVYVHVLIHTRKGGGRVNQR